VTDEGAETVQLGKFGRIVAITREAIINDDLDAFTRIPDRFGVAAANLESDIVWDVLIKNATMADGVALFDAAHANLTGTGTTISVASLGVGKAMMRTQKFSGTVLNIQPKYLVVGSKLETVAAQYIATLTAQSAPNVNPFAGQLIPIVEPRLDTIHNGNAWFLIADPATIDTIELAYLQGERGVQIETRQGFDVDGVEIKARLDVAAKAIDYRGMYKNIGA
jgi:phage major head subunit gpT-like protein